VKEFLPGNIMRILILVFTSILIMLSMSMVIVEPYQFIIIGTGNSAQVANTGVHLVYPWQNYQTYHQNLNTTSLVQINNHLQTADSVAINSYSVTYTWRIYDKKSFAHSLSPMINHAIESETNNYIKNFINSNTYGDILANQTDIVPNPIVLPDKGIEVDNIIITNIN